MRLRAWFVSVNLALAGVALIAASTLVVFGHQLAVASSAVVEDLAAAQAVTAIELELHRYRRQELAWYLTRDESRRVLWTRERAEVARLAAAAATKVSASRSAAFETARCGIEAYLAASPTDAATSSLAFLAAQEPLERIASETSQDAVGHLLEASRSEQTLDLVALALAVAVTGIATFVIISLRLRVLEPVESLRRAIDSFGRTGQLVSGPLQGEFGEIQAALSGMAGTIARQRTGELRFIASVAHDLRTPLTSIKGYCSLVRPGRALPEEAVLRRALEVIERQADRLARQAGDLLDRTRVEAGAFELKPMPLDAAELAREAALLFAGIAPGRITVIAAAPLPVNADADKLHQVLVNLLSNAVKYSPGGGEIELVGKRAESDVVLEVTDHGLGIPAEELERIFEPFRRGTLAMQQEIDGVGLGLSASRRIIEAHDGRLEVRSRPGYGSTFQVWLPGAT